MAATKLVTFHAFDGATERRRIPASAWIGWRNGKPYTWYASRGAGDRAIQRRVVDSTTPAEHYRDEQPAPASPPAGRCLPHSMDGPEHDACPRPLSPAEAWRML